MLYLICSSEAEERLQGVSTILKIRRRPVNYSKSKKQVRRFKPKQINWKASTVAELIDLKKAECEPPLTIRMSDEDIISIVDNPYEPPPFQCISQFVERAVKDTSESVGLVTGSKRQDGVTLNKHLSRKRIKSLKTKPVVTS